MARSSPHTSGTCGPVKRTLVKRTLMKRTLFEPGTSFSDNTPPYFVYALRFSPDGEQLAVFTLDIGTVIWDIKRQRMQCSIPWEGRRFKDFAAAYVANRELVTLRNDGTVETWDTMREVTRTKVLPEDSFKVQEHTRFEGALAVRKTTCEGQKIWLW